MKTIKDFNFDNQRVLVRCDFNVPLEKGKIADDFRLQKTLPTIRYLQNQGAKIILISHLTRDGLLAKKQNLSLKPVAKLLSKLLQEKVKFSSKCLGARTRGKIKGMKAGEIVMLENLRFESGEEANNLMFAKELATLGDLFVNEAFSVCHRSHASIILLPRILPHCAGLELEREVEFLSQVVENPNRPLVAVIGGAKIESKMRVIEKFLTSCDFLLFGGKIANVILGLKGICLKRIWLSDEISEKIKNLNLTDQRVRLPVDVLVSPDASGTVYVRETGPANVRQDEDIFDIGDDTAFSFSEIIRQAKTIFWSGTLGLAENPRFNHGTLKVITAIAQNNQALKIAGGGHTAAFLRSNDLLDKFSFVSVGGGAMLEFLAGEKLPGLEALGYF